MLTTGIGADEHRGECVPGVTWGWMTRWLSSAEHDRIVGIARSLFRCPSAAILIGGRDGDRDDDDDECFSRGPDPCDGTVVVEDTLRDARFASNVLVRAYPHVRYYVGSPIILSGGAVVGTLSVMDYVARERPRDSELAALQSLAALAAGTIELAVQHFSRPAQTAQFEFLAARATTGVLTIGIDGRIIAGNRAAQRLLRLPRDRLAGAVADDFVAGWRLLADDLLGDGATAAALRDGATAAAPGEGATRASRGEVAICAARGTGLRTILMEVVTAQSGIVPALASLSCWVVDGDPVYRLVIDELP